MCLTLRMQYASSDWAFNQTEIVNFLGLSSSCDKIGCLMSEFKKLLKKGYYWNIPKSCS